LLNAASQPFAYSEDLTGQHKTTRKGFKKFTPSFFEKEGGIKNSSLKAVF